MKNQNINAWAIPETKLPWTPLIQAAIQQQGKNICSAFKAVGASRLEGTIGTSQPGGMCLLTRGDKVGCIAQVSQDSRGLDCWCDTVLNR
eukprot:9359594-Ditylum_brightwellii.AAC.1